jgi:hypothetical protein
MDWHTDPATPNAPAAEAEASAAAPFITESDRSQVQ